MAMLLPWVLHAEDAYPGPFVGYLRLSTLGWYIINFRLDLLDISYSKIGFFPYSFSSACSLFFLFQVSYLFAGYLASV